MNGNYCEEEYELLKYHLEEYMEDPVLKDNVDECYANCEDCKSKIRVEKSEKYFNKMIKVINSDRYYYVEKLQRIYFYKMITLKTVVAFKNFMKL